MKTGNDAETTRLTWLSILQKYLKDPLSQTKKVLELGDNWYHEMYTVDQEWAIIDA